MPKSRSRLAIWSHSSRGTFPSTPDSRIKAGEEKPKMEINARENVVKTLRCNAGGGLDPSGPSRCYWGYGNDRYVEERRRRRVKEFKIQ